MSRLEELVLELFVTHANLTLIGGYLSQGDIQHLARHPLRSEASIERTLKKLVDKKLLGFIDTGCTYGGFYRLISTGSNEVSIIEED